MLPSALCISQGLFVGEKVREMSGEENFEKKKKILEVNRFKLQKI